MCGKLLPVVVAVAWLAVFTGPVPADSGVVSPDSIPGTTKVDAEDVLELAEKNPELVVVQGFFVSRPLPYDELIRWLSSSAWSAKQRPSFSSSGGRKNSVVALRRRPRPGPSD